MVVSKSVNTFENQIYNVDMRRLGNLNITTSGFFLSENTIADKRTLRFRYMSPVVLNGLGIKNVVLPIPRLQTRIDRKIMRCTNTEKNELSTPVSVKKKP